MTQMRRSQGISVNSLGLRCNTSNLQLLMSEKFKKVYSFDRQHQIMLLLNGEFYLSSQEMSDNQNWMSSDFWSGCTEWQKVEKSGCYFWTILKSPQFIAFPFSFVVFSKYLPLKKVWTLTPEAFHRLRVCSQISPVSCWRYTPLKFINEPAAPFEVDCHL